MIRAVLASLVLLAAGPAGAQGLVREELRIPMAAAGPRGLEALLVKPNDGRPHPLALISHGAPRDADDRPEMSAFRYDPQAAQFARRGFAVLVVMRRGYGTSGGDYSESNRGCNAPNYPAAANASIEDLRAAIDAMRKRSDVSVQGMIAIGQSAGGFATVALTADPPPGLVAAISFAGGRGSIAPGKVCDETRLIETFGSFGQSSRVPMLWIYTKNDQFFAPALAHQFHEAFTAGGGRAELIDAPAFGNDGHALFASGIDIWSPVVDRFLHAQNLGLREPLADPVSGLAPPAQLKNRDAFAAYLKAGHHRAFAVSPNGSFGWRSGRRTADEARDAALATCADHAANCAVYAVDDAVTGGKK